MFQLSNAFHSHLCKATRLTSLAGIWNPVDGDVAVGTAYFAGRSPAIGDVVLGREIFRGEGGSTCISAFCSWEEQLLHEVCLLCPDDSGDRFNRGTLPAILPIISTTSYSWEQENTNHVCYNNIAGATSTLYLQTTVQVRLQHAACSRIQSHKKRCTATQLTLFALLFVFELAGMEMREVVAASAPLGVTSARQLASPNASEDLALSVKLELILAHRRHGDCSRLL